MANIALIFPHQLFEHSPLIKQCDTFYLIEEWLFFHQYSFHKQKIAYHRATMKWYASYLGSNNKKVIYIDAIEDYCDIRKFIPELKKQNIDHFNFIDPTDNWLEKRIRTSCKKHGLSATMHPQQLFINSKTELEAYFGNRKTFFMADFYTHQRKSRKILLEEDGKPIGGKWSFDADNRKKYPLKKQPPKIDFHSENPHYEEAVAYTEKHFSKHHGNLQTHYLYPSTYQESKAWLKTFLRERFEEFGPYEDSMVSNQHILHHSVLTPMLNTGLLMPGDVINEALDYASENEVPLNSLEGFIRQILGWREFMRAVYEYRGTAERTKNFWGFKRKIPPAFWRGATGIEPVDTTIRKVLDTGYCHHIERLMNLGNFMLLCEFDPDEVYRFFMELFIDSYDWVMVPNIYGMSQFSDGGMMSTKPYISGSNYITRMSDYPKGDWQETWDALFWRFMHVQRTFFESNPRLGLLLKTLDKMTPEKREGYIAKAAAFLEHIEKH
ncbi:MAG: cryptochrome/photolyase family protein [Flavitalea sp.]